MYAMCVYVGGWPHLAMCRLKSIIVMSLWRGDSIRGKPEWLHWLWCIYMDMISVGNGDVSGQLAHAMTAGMK